jgi:hypothetical protein
MPDKGPGILRSLERITQSPTRVRSWLRVIGVPPATTLPLQARSWLAALFVAAAAGIAGANEPSSKDMAFFTEQIQPILKDRCYECHSHDSGKTKGGLALDFRSGWSVGGDSGAAVIPGKPEESLLIQAVRRVDNDTAMPPKKPLPEAELALLTEWVKRGAPDPRVNRAVAMPNNDWWSLKPLAPADSQHNGLPGTPGIDAFVQAKLAENGLTMSPEADRRTLMRRIYFDLHGLAPHPEEVASFAADSDPQAYEKLVDRLLASPRYGERWARHWFDTIHFADTHGFEHDEIRDGAWRYRDYVIGALNADTPWPRFIREQLAADVFYPNEPRLTPALGFLGAGPLDLSAADTAPKMFELVDRDDLVTQTMGAFTSTTAGCARCHDHKFDPISQEDYYALAAVFAGLVKGDLTFEDDPDVGQARRRWQQLATAAKQRDPAVLLAPEAQQSVATWELERGPAANWEVPSSPTVASAGGATIEVRDDGSIYSGGQRPETEILTVTMAPKLRTITAVRLEVLTDPSLPKQGPGRQDNGNLHLNECEIFFVEKEAEQPRKVRISRATADFDQQGWTIAHALDGNEKSAWGIFPRVGESHLAVFELAEPLTLGEGNSLRVLLKQVHGGGHVIGRLRLAVTNAPPGQLAIMPSSVAEVLPVPRDQRNEAQRLTIAAHALAEKAAQELAKLPPAPTVFAAAKSVTRKGKPVMMNEPRTIHVLARGELTKPGEIANPGALACIEPLQSRFMLTGINDEGARRAALADWLADPRNPLTPRSIVNRIWHYHFGRGLAATPNDLGRMGSLPSHPELLDWLAADFRDSGGSLKRLHRQIVLSATYRQSSSRRQTNNETGVDSDNVLLWRANRQRLDAESFRDIVLQVAGQLDLTMGGPPVMHFKLGPAIQSTPTLDYAAFNWDQPGVTKRSIYRLVYRNIPDPFMAALDFPDAAQLAPARGFSASALQALALWNDDFVLRQSEKLAARLEQSFPDTAERVRRLVELVFLRVPSSDESREFVSYAEKHGLPALCRVLFNSNEFLFVN